MGKIIVSVAGWCEADPEKVRFQLVSNIEGEEYITGAEWLKLPEYHDTAICRDDYILECAGTAFATAIDGEYDNLDIEVEE